MKAYVMAAMVFLVGCSSPEDEARELLGAARTFEAEASALIRSDSGRPQRIEEPAVDECISKANKAKESIDRVYSDYASSAVSNEMGTRVLKGQINMILRECNRLKKLYGAS